MANSIRENIILNVLSRLEVIYTTNGYQTDLGNNVFRAYVSVDPNEAPFCNVFPGIEEKENYHGALLMNMPIRIEGYSIVGVSQSSSVIAEKILADIVESMTSRMLKIEFQMGSTTDGGSPSGREIRGATNNGTALIDHIDLSSGSWSDSSATGYAYFRRINGSFDSLETILIDSGYGTFSIKNDGISVHSPKEFIGYIDRIEYSSGGVDSYPDEGVDVVAAFADFNLFYKTKTGNPFEQPS